MLLAEKRRRVAGILGTLDGVSPLATLQRGYSILQTEPAGRVVRRAQDVRVGQLLKATVSVGHLMCQVQETSFKDPSA